LERRLTAGELALRDALAELATVTVELDPAHLVNVNAPEELAVLRP
jgi:molybdopterin-guanine dinucleotide biosynthesis protein A